MVAGTLTVFGGVAWALYNIVATVVHDSEATALQQAGNEVQAAQMIEAKNHDIDRGVDGIVTTLLGGAVVAVSIRQPYERLP